MSKTWKNRINFVHICGRVPNDDHTVEVTVYPRLDLPPGRGVWGVGGGFGGGLMAVEVSNGEEQWEGILIISAAAPAISTYETDRAKHQLMQRYPQRGSLSPELRAAAFWLQKRLRSAKRLWWKMGVLVFSVHLAFSVTKRFADCKRMRVEAKKKWTVFGFILFIFMIIHTGQQQIWWRTYLHVARYWLLRYLTWSNTIKQLQCDTQNKFLNKSLGLKSLP